MIGKVCFFSPNGWGFIRPVDSDGQDFFLHHSNLIGLKQRQIMPNMALEFDPGIRNNRPVALNVRVPDPTVAVSAENYTVQP